MNAAIWTLWLISYGTNSPAVVTKLAIYETHDACWNAVGQYAKDMKLYYDSNNPPSPGLLFCMGGTAPPR